MKQRDRLWLSFVLAGLVMSGAGVCPADEGDGASLPASSVAPTVTPVGPGDLVAPGMSPAPSNVSVPLPASLPAPVPAQSPVMLNPLVRAGSNITGVGLGAMIGGGVFILLGNLLPCDLGEPGCDTETWQSDQEIGDVFIGVGVGFLIAGGVAVVVGVPLWIVGYRQAVREMEQPRALRPQFHLGANGVGFRF